MPVFVARPSKIIFFCLQVWNSYGFISMSEKCLAPLNLLAFESKRFGFRFVQNSLALSPCNFLLVLVIVVYFSHYFSSIISLTGCLCERVFARLCGARVRACV